MDSVYGSNVSGTAPAAPAVPLVGFPRAGNSLTGEKATRPGPYWFHMVTQELRNVITAAGLTPDAADLTQLLQAIQALGGMNGEVGKVSFVPSTTPNEDHMPLFGAEVSRTGVYAELWAYAQASGTLVNEATFASRPGCFGYGPGGVGGTTFRVPKINGLVIKAFHNGDGTYTTNTSALIGQYMADEVKAHAHLVDFGTSEGDNTSNCTNGGGTAGSFWTSSSGGAENTVRSVILFPQIRYRR